MFYNNEANGPESSTIVLNSQITKSEAINMKSTSLSMIAVKDLAHGPVYTSREFVHARELYGL